MTSVDQEDSIEVPYLYTTTLYAGLYTVGGSSKVQDPNPLTEVGLSPRWMSFLSDAHQPSNAYHQSNANQPSNGYQPSIDLKQVRTLNNEQLSSMETP
jgi:hypothetical protein